MLVVGGELLVRGASRFAAAVGISPLVIGLTVVAFGTSAPEAAVALRSSLYGQVDIALGNAVGSNICNVLLVLGLSATIAPLVVARQLVRLDVPLMIGVSVVLLLVSLNGRISSVDGALLFSALGALGVLDLLNAANYGKVWAKLTPVYRTEHPRIFAVQKGLDAFLLLGGIIGVVALLLFIPPL